MANPAEAPQPPPAAAADRRPRVAIVFGGRSSEHGISCVSGGNVLGAIDRDRYDVVAVGITPDGAWHMVADEPERYRIVGGVVPSIPADGPRVHLTPDPTVAGLLTDDGRTIPVDVLFPVLHGAGGEDGSVQGVCELAGIPYVGSGIAASAVCMDKIRTKDAAVAAGIPVGPYVGVPDRAWLSDPEAVLAAAAKLELPLFVKPARAGSSVGISKVDTADELAAAIENARQHDRRVIIEQGVVGARELECGVLGSAGGPSVSEVAEIEVLGEHEFYDFTAKYLDSSARITVPADLTLEERVAVRTLAARAFTAFGCEGMARVDVFLTADGDVLLNEPNTIPGFTSSSMYPVVWQAAGVSYAHLIDALIADALHRGANPEVSPT
ncbi:MAG: D-alanine--D-alanine ligase family protein [Candidatus Nanopelagicales bacterium]